MLRFISALFPPPEQPEGLDDALIEKAIERVVAGTDRRLHALPDFRKRLRGPVEQTIGHVVALIDALPAPAPISPQAFGADPKLRALFASADHLREVCGGFSSVRDYLQGLDGPPPDEIFGMLIMAREERKVFAAELHGDTLRRDVLQVAVNFSNHRYILPAASEQDSRRELKKRAFDFLVEKALERIADERGKRRDLDRQRLLLRQKLDAMRNGRWGLGAMADDGEGQYPNLAALEAEIAALEAELGHSRDKLGIAESLDCVIDTLSQPAAWLGAREVTLRLDYRGMKVADTAAAAVEVALTELFSGEAGQRTVLLGRIARAELPEPADFWKAAKRYL
ncbi:MAG: hypothetical protein ACKN9T_16045 [Candidatus Methylumidiphilus sp.]